MRVGIPKEVKDNEYRVSTTPAGVRELVAEGNDVLLERGAGLGSSIADEEYLRAGGTIVDTAEELWAASELVCKVKEPASSEYRLLRSGLILFTYLHLAASRECTDALLDSGVTAIAYETVQQPDTTLPLLAPMSEVAGRMAPLAGAEHLQAPKGGRGVLISGVPGVRPAHVVVLGAGVAGSNAVAIATGMHADVTVIDRDLTRLAAIDALHRVRVSTTIAASEHAIEQACVDADLVIGAVLVVGARTPHLVSDALVKQMSIGSVLVDISVDQGGCFESSHPTTHSDPTFVAHGSVFYCVSNMPGAVPHTATYALANATLPYTLSIATFGWREAARRDDALARGINTVAGELISGPVGEAHGLSTTSISDIV